MQSFTFDPEQNKQVKTIEAFSFLMENGSYATIGSLSPKESDELVRDLYIEAQALSVAVSHCVRDCAYQLHIISNPHKNMNVYEIILSTNPTKIVNKNNLFKIIWDA